MRGRPTTIEDGDDGIGHGCAGLASSGWERGRWRRVVLDRPAMARDGDDGTEWREGRWRSAPLGAGAGAGGGSSGAEQKMKLSQSELCVARGERSTALLQNF
jgi:hypothetical protein